LADVRLFIPRRDADRNQRRIKWRRRRRYDNIKLILIVNPIDDDDPKDAKNGGCDKKRHGLNYRDDAAPLGLFDFDAIWECIFEFIKMRDDEYFFKVTFDNVNRLDQTLTPLCIL